MAIEIREVSPRDGLQSQSRIITTKEKLEYIETLAESGLTHIEATGFSRPDIIPQLADASDVATRLEAREGITYSVLIPNLIGYRRARKTGIQGIAVFSAASEAFNQANSRKTITQSIVENKEIIKRAKEDGLFTRAYISTAFSCPFNGCVSIEDVQHTAVSYLGAGADEIVLADTTGTAYPDRIKSLLVFITGHIPSRVLAFHFHNLYGQALGNVAQAYEMGVTRFDASTGGLGGCPISPGAPGNIDTLEILDWAVKKGITSNVESYKVLLARNLLQGKLLES